MRIIAAVTSGLLLVSVSGCAHGDYYTFANTRKLLESDALAITKIAFVVPLAISETVITPATSYMDAVEYSSEKDHVYLSYLGMQTLVNSEMHGLYKLMAGTVILPVDTLWFPVAGTVDTAYAINRSAPAQGEDVAGGVAGGPEPWFDRLAF